MCPYIYSYIYTCIRIHSIFVSTQPLSLTLISPRNPTPHLIISPLTLIPTPYNPNPSQEKLKLQPNDTDEIKSAKRKKVHALKSAHRLKVLWFFYITKKITPLFARTVLGCIIIVHALKSAHRLKVFYLYFFILEKNHIIISAHRDYVDVYCSILTKIPTLIRVSYNSARP